MRKRVLRKVDRIVKRAAKHRRADNTPSSDGSVSKAGVNAAVTVNAQVSCETPLRLEYVSPPEVPDSFWREMASIVGINPKTDLPWVRFVWGCDRVDFAAGRFVRRYPDVKNKYVGVPNWVMEGWQSPEIYNRAEWEQNKDLLGDYPTGGVWDFVEFVRNPDMSYRPLDGRALDMCRQWKRWHEPRRAEFLADLIKMRERLLMRERMLAQEISQKRYDEMFDEVMALEKRSQNNAYSMPSLVRPLNITGAGQNRISPGGIILP